MRERKSQRKGSESNRIAIPFDKAVEALLSVKPKKKPAKKGNKPAK